MRAMIPGQRTARRRSRPARARVRVKTPPLLFDRTQDVMARIRPRVKGTFLSYWMSTSGSVCDNDVMAMHELLHDLGPQPSITLFVKSDGGSGMAALRLVHLLRRYTRRLAVAAPLNCASAATMLALGADEILMGPLSFLTAVDTSLEHDLSPVDHTNNLVAVSNDEVDRVIRLWKEHAGAKGPQGAHPHQELYKYLHPLVVGALDRASSLSLKVCQEILAYHMKDRRKAERISRRLNYDYPAHQYPISSREARNIGLTVRDLDPQLDQLLQELNLVYSEMGQRAITDYDEENHHDNEITNILERRQTQVFYQVEKDWHYRKEERRWVPMNDLSAWYRCRREKGRLVKTKFHIR
ncbi:MAG TPA: hypothetical protein VFO85_15810 [Vicinamibacteria bacterium]|nr:hypothetical protein [Vicinamibacteria bacterium]